MSSIRLMSWGPMKPCLSKSIISKARRSSSSVKALLCNPGIMKTSSSVVLGAALTLASCMAAVAAALGLTGTASASCLSSSLNLRRSGGSFTGTTALVSGPPGRGNGGTCGGGGGRACRAGSPGSAGKGGASGGSAPGSASNPAGGGGGGGTAGRASIAEDPGNGGGIVVGGGGNCIGPPRAKGSVPSSPVWLPTAGGVGGPPT
mmetsp:Transcript_31989/g.74959  ORF Transcript_31989/g.74959 Transcript_31989/m.74959 type:complete len:204 (+) Transcript_31989:984-1595(+)